MMLGKQNQNNAESTDSRPLGTLALTALLFFNVGGGPFGTEELQQTGGPLFSLFGLLVLSLLWSLPVGLMTAELGTAFPRDGGYVLWVDAAFGEFWAFQVEFIFLLSSINWIQIIR
jgi:amino acid transporter